ncbi:hypothetical protein [Candidatus Ichthyocystis hellenicum]|uniref:hypothetical protein n=1 Tax=Candidatus Ichthyocystis hellenicum TaxID=1561003 RepID=UPI000B89EE3E|nr:hypothetical protein [Candidatus Ichthyocystis hellenicum]
MGIMRTSGVDFLSIVSDDAGNSDLVSSSSLSSVSQSSISCNALSRVCRLVGGGLRKFSFLGSAVLLSSLLSTVESASAQCSIDKNWELVKSKVCTLLFIESSANRSFEESFYRVDARSVIKSILGEDKLSRDLTSDYQLSIMIMRLKNAYKPMLYEFIGKVFEAAKKGVDVPSQSYRNIYWVDAAKVADTSVCPDLYDFFNNTLSTSSPATTVPMTTTTDSISTDVFTPVASAKDEALIFAVALFIFASIVRNKCPSLKNMSFARFNRAILGRKERREIEEVSDLELEEVVCHSMFSQAAYKRRSTGKSLEQLYYVV